MARGKKRKTRSDKGKPRKRARKNSYSRGSSTDNLLLKKVIADEAAKQQAIELARLSAKIDDEEELVAYKPWERQQILEKRRLDKLKKELEAKKQLANPDFNPASLALTKQLNPEKYLSDMAALNKIKSDEARAGLAGQRSYSDPKKNLKGAYISEGTRIGNTPSLATIGKQLSMRRTASIIPSGDTDETISWDEV